MKLYFEAWFFFRGCNTVDLNEWQKSFEPLKHIGLYAYTKNALKRFHNYKSSPLELSESLEQMRFIDNKEKIVCTEVTDSHFSVDYPNDIKKIEKLIKSKKRISK